MSILWKPLSVSRTADTPLPPLLISATFGIDSYAVHLTDLTHLWSESLDHKAIFQRSQVESTSIDPSDSDQLQIFLDKIKSGIEGGKDTTSSLSFEDSRGRPDIKLDITVRLPAGLDDLEWSIHLSAAPQSLLTSQLTIPLMEAQHARSQEITNLIEVLNHKDHVIQKLLDKFEEQGTQLGQLFPQVAVKGGRKISRAKAEEKVNGLGQFDIETWKKKLDNAKSRDVTELLKEVFGGGASENEELHVNTDLSVANDNWWESRKGKTVDLSGGSGVNRSALSKSNKENAPSRPSKYSAGTLLYKSTSADLYISTATDPDESMQDEVEFQVQTTPPRVISPRSKKQTPPLDEDESINDDDDFAPPSQHAKVLDRIASPSPQTKPPAKVKGLGPLGGKKVAAPRAPSPMNEDTTDEEAASPVKPSPKKSSPEQPARKKKGGLGRIGGKKEPPRPPSPSPREPTPPPVETPKPKKGKLGTIGGKKKAVTAAAKAPVENAEEPPSSTPPPKDVTTPVKKKLGTIGGKAKTPAKEGSVSFESCQGLVQRGRSANVEEKVPTPPRETSEEHADRRRMELKRELEAKAKAPVKKKRKF